MKAPEFVTLRAVLDPHLKRLCRLEIVETGQFVMGFVGCDVHVGSDLEAPGVSGFPATIRLDNLDVRIESMLTPDAVTA